MRKKQILFAFVASLLATNANANVSHSSLEYYAEDDRETSLPDNIEKLVGVDINGSKPSALASVGNPTAITATVTTHSELMKKIFVIYNIGTKKFLNSGTWWGTHATLSESPKLFWLQRRNEVKQNITAEVRYPDDGNEYVFTTNVTSPDLSIVNSAIKHEKSGILGLTTLQVGSKEGDGRSHATYTKMQHIRTADDGTETVVRDLLEEYGEGYQPNGSKFGFDVDDFDISTDKIVAEVNLADCYNQNKGKSPECILSIGNAIANWNFSSTDEKKGAGEYNIHMYYNSDTKGFDVDYIDATARFGGDTSNWGNGQARSTISNVRGNATITYSKDGITISGLSPLTLRVPYVAEKAGDIVNFKYESGGNIYINNNNEYEIDETGSGKPFSLTHETYLYTLDNSDGNATWFISSKIQSTSSASKNEDKFMGYAPYDNGTASLGNGTVGCFVDRSVDSDARRELGQWSFEPVTLDGESGNIYNICLKIPYDESTGKQNTEKGEDGHTLRTKFYLEADNSYVTGLAGYKTEYPNRYYHIADTDQNGKIDNGYNTAELHTDIDKTNPNNCWKVISLGEYIELIGGVKSEMENPIDLTFLLSDPEFTRENAGLGSWKTDASLASTSAKATEAKLRIGFDGYYKTSTAQKDYWSDADVTGETNNSANHMLISHSQYMCAAIQNGGRGRIYQDVVVYYPGWYELTCQGMSNVDAKLFVQRLSGIGDGATVTSDPIVKDLKKVTADDITAIRHKSTSGLYWPYDSDMLMYNAAVMMNDEDLPAADGDEEQSYMKYRNYVLIYIDKVNDELISRENPAFLRFGVDVQNGSDGISEGDEYTLIDNFHLLFGGKSEEPNLILNENETNLDYIDDYMHVYDNKPMHLYRTFTEGVWNTLQLPVSLTKAQFTGAFGSNAKLAELYELTESSVRFTYVQPENDDDIMLEANKPYIIKPSNVGAGNTEYTATLINRNNPSKSLTKTCPDNHFLIENVTLPYQENTATEERWYDFGNLDEYNATIDGTKYKYVVDAKSSGSHDGGTLHCYGTLCKTYETVSEGGNSNNLKIIDGRPRLNNGNAYIMKGGSMIKVPFMENGYGLKGFRCWFQYEAEGGVSKPSAVSLIINGIGDDATDINDIAAADGIQTISKYADGVYTISGQRIGSRQQINMLPKGMYILNGKKYIIR